MKLRKNQKIFAACCLSAVALLGISACAMIDNPTLVAEKSKKPNNPTTPSLAETFTYNEMPYKKVKSINDIVANTNYLIAWTPGFVNGQSKTELTLTNGVSEINNAHVFNFEPVTGGYAISDTTANKYLSVAEKSITYSDEAVALSVAIQNNALIVKNTGNGSKYTVVRNGKYIRAYGSLNSSYEYPLLYKEDVVKHKVTFKDELGQEIESVMIVDGEVAEPIADPTKPDTTEYTYFFDGWYTEDGTKYDFKNPITADLVLNARFTEELLTYKTKFNKENVSTSLHFNYTFEGQSPLFAGASIDYSSGANVTDNANFSRDNKKMYNSSSDKGAKFDTDGDTIAYKVETGINEPVDFSFVGHYNSKDLSHFDVEYYKGTEKLVTEAEKVPASVMKGTGTFTSSVIAGCDTIKFVFNKNGQGNCNYALEKLTSKHLDSSKYYNFRNFHLNFSYNFNLNEEKEILETGMVIGEGTSLAVTDGMTEEALGKVSKIKQVKNELTESQVKFTVGVEFNRENLATYLNTSYVGVGYIKTAEGYYFTEQTTQTFADELAKAGEVQENAILLNALKKDLNI